MENKTVIITGVSGNMGQAVLHLFLEKGYKVIGTAAPNDPFDFSHERFEKVVVDLMDEVATGTFMQQVLAKHKTIDAAVLTVGGFAMGSIKETKTSDILHQYKLNFETAYNVACPAFVQMMEQKHGRIFIIGSRPGLDAAKSKGMVAYGLAKSLIFRLAELLNHEAEGTDVVTSVIVPSTIDTPQNRHSMPDGEFDKWVKPESIAEAIYFYCTDAAKVLREPVLKVYNRA